MKKTLLVMALAIALVLSMMATALANGGPHDRATGEVTWEIPGGPLAGDTVYTKFNAHDGAPGSKGTTEDRGTVTTTHKGVTRTVDLDCVQIEENEAWFSGVDNNGAPVVFYVQDNATPGADGDLFNQWTNSEYTCTDGWSVGGEVLDGNLKVHSSAE